MNVTFKRWSEICTDIKTAYAVNPLNEDADVTIINVLHNEDAYVQVAVHHNGDDADDLYVRLVQLPSQVRNNYPKLVMPEYDDIMAVLPSDYDLLIEE